jgi:antitoxin MazE
VFDGPAGYNDVLRSEVEKPMRTSIRKLGNSSGVILPKALLAETGIVTGDSVDLVLENGRITITLVKRRPREGWDEAFDDVGELSEGDREWMEFGNAGDDELKW